MTFKSKPISDEDFFSKGETQVEQPKIENPYGDKPVSDADLVGVNEAAVQQPQQDEGLWGNANPVSLGMEAIGGVNRALPGFIDALGVDTVNSILKRSGVDYQLPSVVDTLGLGKPGDFAGEGLATDVASRTGEGAAMALNVVGAGRKVLQEGSEQLGKILVGEGAKREAALGALSGTGSAAGEAIGGTPGAIIGGMLAPGVAPSVNRNVGPLDAGGNVEFEAQEINRTRPDDLKEELATASPERAAQLADPDLNTLEQLSDFGVTSQPPASVVSNNPAFVDVEGPLSASAKSPIRSQNNRFLKDLSDQVGNFFKRHGASVNEDGLVDFSVINNKFRDDSSQLINKIYEGEKIFYKGIEEIVPKTNKLFTPNIFKLMDDLSSDQGSFDNLPEALKGIFNKLKSGENPTFGYMNTKRQDIGDAISRKQGPFKDINVGMLKRIYGALADDINGHLESIDLEGFGTARIGKNQVQPRTAKDIVDMAKRMTVKRKTIESSLVDVLGKDLSKELSSTLSKDIGSLRKGEMQGFKKTMVALRKITGGNYDSSFRQEAVMTAIRDQFKTQNGELLIDPTKYRQFMDNLNSNKEAKKLIYRELPKNAKRNMEALHNFSKRIYQFNLRREKTGINFVSYDDPNKGLIARLYDANATDALVGASDFATMKLFGVRSGSHIKNIYSSVKKKDRNMDHVVTNLLVSDKFQKALLKRDPLAIKKIPAYRKWLDSVSEATQNSIARRGPIAYFLAEGEDETVNQVE